MKTATCLFFSCALAAFFPCLVLADERDDRIRALEQRVEQLEKLLRERLSQPTPSAEPLKSTETSKPSEIKPGPSLSVGSSGFMMRSADTNFVLRLRGLFQLDSRWYV